MSWSLSGHPRCGHPRTDHDEALDAPARRGEHPTVNEKNRTHLPRSCATTALLIELRLECSRATNRKVGLELALGTRPRLRAHRLWLAAPHSVNVPPWVTSDIIAGSG